MKRNLTFFSIYINKIPFIKTHYNHRSMYAVIYSTLLIHSIIFTLNEAIVLTEKNREQLVDCLQTCQYGYMTCEYKCFKIIFCKNICDKTYYECQKSCYIEVFHANETL
ncbi:hypothetical protein EWB00_003101 [Schistosoma japonicum]|uniref:Uncharacterized protein n=1 Tax=Schistosoma japonicum TaxID=6182 RepID=A0A4Z2D9H1_SCHJA|nr:hypothetical protein KSF78_0004063 [Schistosoma japonicum]TNN13143.1 hypothetical protein EWB00_003101 [Schistosoma japonicum]